jgi:phosphonate degradation associated HDIG domain protein
VKISAERTLQPGDFGARISSMQALDEVFGLLEASAGAAYIGEPVSQLEHALQAAALAREAGARDALVVAALLHDVGHLCAAQDAPRMAGLGVLEHEHVGGEYLRARGFSDEVCRLIAGHVAAKRYLVRTRAAYAANLSEASRGTLAYQGGPMRDDEVAAFERDPLHRDMLRLRAWDEQAKQPGLQVPTLDAYKDAVRAAMAAAS